MHESGHYESSPLRGPWTPLTAGKLEVSLRYSPSGPGPCASWSGWSQSAGLVLSMASPLPSEAMEVEFDDYNPCQATLRWNSFEIFGCRSPASEYRVLLKDVEAAACETCGWQLWTHLEADQGADGKQLCILTGLQLPSLTKGLSQAFTRGRCEGLTKGWVSERGK